MAKKSPKQTPLTEADWRAQAQLKALWDKRPAPKITQEAAGVIMGITQGAVGHYLHGRVALGATAVMQFASILRCDPRQIRDDLPALKTMMDVSRSRVADGSAVGLYDAYASAGEGHQNSQFTRIGELTFRIGSLEKKGIDPEHADIHFVVGRSMEPRLYDGDAILFDTRETDAIKDGCMYVIEWNGNRFVKRLFRELNGSIRVVSDNSAPEYQDRIVQPGDAGFSIKGRVRWVGSWEH